MNISPCAFLVVGEDLKKQWDSDFIKYLKENGFVSWKIKGFYEGCNWLFININNKTFAPGMPGIKITYIIGDHAITIEEFISIYETYKKYEGLKPLELKKTIN